MMIREGGSGVLECRGLDPRRRDVAPGGIVVVFQDAGTEDLVGEIEACRSRWGPVGLLVVVPPDGSASLETLAGRVDGPWDVIRPDATVDEWRLRTDRLVTQVEALGELEELRFRATHDDLTGLLRPAEFDRRLREQFSAAQRHGHELSLVLIDLDRFGVINKQFDHLVGDGVIERVAAAVRNELRSEDVAGRLGGDEFAVLLPFTGATKAARVVERLRQRIREVSGPLASEGESNGREGVVQVSGSLGFETYPAARVASVEGLRGHAELALRAAKRSGGDRGVFYRLLEEESRGRGGSAGTALGGLGECAGEAWGSDSTLTTEAR